MPADAATPRCEIIHPLLSAYLDNETTPTEAALVQAHVAVCERCASELAFLRLTHAALSNPTEAPIPAALSARIAAATYARPTLRQRLSVWLQPAPVRLAALGAATAAAVGVIAASALLRENAAPRVETASRPAVEHPAPKPVTPPAPPPQPRAATPKPIPPAPSGKGAGPRKAPETTERTAPEIEAPSPDRIAEPTAAAPPRSVPEKKIRNAEPQVAKSTAPPAPDRPALPKQAPPQIAHITVPSPPPPLPTPEPAATAIKPAIVDVPAPEEAPPAPPAPPNNASRVVRSPAMDSSGRIRVSRSVAVAEVVRFPVSGVRSGAIRPGSYPEPGQPPEAGVAFVSAPVQ